MEKLKNLIKIALEKGFATSDERAEIVEIAEDFTTEELEELTDDIITVENLPLEKPEEAKTDENNDPDLPRETRAERRAKARGVKGK